MKYYTSINTCPLINYINATESNDMRYLLILDSYDDLPKIDNVQKSELSNTYLQLISQFPEDSFDNELSRRILKVKLMKYDMIANDKKHLKAIIDIENDKINKEQGKKSESKLDYYDEVTQIEILLKITIDLHKTTLRKFFSYRKQVKNITSKKTHE